ncbi:MAG: hypothetical protein ABI876_07640 [Bacteroidota bacterium]
MLSTLLFAAEATKKTQRSAHIFFSTYAPHIFFSQRTRRMDFFLDARARIDFFSRHTRHAIFFLGAYAAWIFFLDARACADFFLDARHAESFCGRGRSFPKNPPAREALFFIAGSLTVPIWIVERGVT